MSDVETDERSYHTPRSCRGSKLPSREDAEKVKPKALRREEEYMQSLSELPTAGGIITRKMHGLCITPCGCHVAAI
jgi:hypothetical protein